MSFLLGIIVALLVIAIAGTVKISIFNRISSLEKDVEDLNELISEITGGDE